MDAASKRIVDFVLKRVGEQLGDQLREIKALRSDLEHAKRQIGLLELQERGNRNRRSHRRMLRGSPNE
jgi:hypothetical protein